MNAIIAEMSDFLVSQSIHLAVLFALILALAVLFRKQSAHLRYLLWAVILVKCLVPPVLTIPVAVLPQKDVPVERQDAAADLRLTPSIEQPVALAAQETTLLDPPIEVQGPVTQISEPDSIRQPLVSMHVGVQQWGILVWVAGMGVLLLGTLIRAIRFAGRLKCSRLPLDPSLRQQIDSLAGTFRSGLTVKAYQLEGISQPFVWGLVRGTIYLPANFASTGTDNARFSVLLHEMAHVVRLDPLINLIQILVQGVYWFHPMVWIANQKIRAEREKCCDEIAIARQKTSPKAYGSAIVDTLVHEYESRMVVPSLAVAGPVKNIEDRIKTIMKPGKKFHTCPSLKALVVTFLFAVMAVPTTIAFTQRQEPVNTEDSRSTVPIATDKVAYSNMEYIVPAQAHPNNLGSVQTVELFGLSEMHVSGWPIREGYRDLIKTILIYNKGDIYYFYDKKEKVGKVIFPRQAIWDRTQPLLRPDSPSLILNKLPLDVLLTTVDGCCYQIRFSNPKGPRTRMMMGPLQGRPGNMEKQCLIQVKKTEDAIFTVDLVGSEFDNLCTQVFLNPKNKVFEGITQAVFNQDEAIAYCTYSDVLSQYAFDGKPTSKEVRLKKLSKNQWQITKVTIDHRSLIESNRRLYLEKNSGERLHGAVSITFDQSGTNRSYDSQSAVNPNKTLHSLFMASGMLCQSIQEALQADDFEMALSLCDQVEKNVVQGLAIADEVPEGPMFKALATHFRLWHNAIKTQDKDHALKIGEMLNDMGSNMAPQVEEMAREDSSENSVPEPAGAQAFSKDDLPQIEQLIQAFSRVPFTMDLETAERLFEFKDDQQKQRFTDMIRAGKTGFDDSSQQGANEVYILSIKPAGNNRFDVSALTPFQDCYMLRTVPCVRRDRVWKIGIDIQKMLDRTQQAKELGPEELMRREALAQLQMWENATGQTLVTLYEDAKAQAQLRVQAMQFAREKGLRINVGNTTKMQNQEHLDQILAQSPETLRTEMILQLKRQLGPEDQYGKLEFRILPNAAASGRVPGQMTAAEEQRLRDLLRNNGPINASVQGQASLWLPLRSGLNLQDAVVEEYQAQKYVLLSNEPNQIMTADGSWGLVAVSQQSDAMGRRAIGLELDQPGGEKLKQFTSHNIKRTMAIILDGQVLSAPTIMSAVGQHVLITGRFTEQEVHDMVVSLQKGMMRPKSTDTPSEAFWKYWGTKLKSWF